MLRVERRQKQRVCDHAPAIIHRGEVDTAAAAVAAVAAGGMMRGVPPVNK